MAIVDPIPDPAQEPGLPTEPVVPPAEPGEPGEPILPPSEPDEPMLPDGPELP